jgi:hypothetical protein
MISMAKKHTEYRLQKLSCIGNISESNVQKSFDGPVFTITGFQDSAHRFLLWKEHNVSETASIPTSLRLD